MKQFFYTSELKSVFDKKAGTIFSESFFRCMLNKISIDFCKKTGLENDKKVLFQPPDSEFKYVTNEEISTFNAIFFIESIVMNYPVKLSWQSKNDLRTYNFDEEVKCENIELKI